MVEIIRKKYIQKILQNNYYGSVIFLTGVRYSGKSIILKQAYNELKKQNHEDYIKFIDFKKIRLSAEEKRNILMKIFDTLIYEKGSKYLFIDNIEYLDKWGLIIHSNTKYKNDLKVYISLKNSNYITNNEFRQVLYKRQIEIFPFSFNEFIEYHNITSSNNDKLTDKELFREYQRYGGLPEVSENNKLSYKSQIIKWSYEDSVYPNIYQLYFKDFAKDLTRYLIETMGQEFSETIFQKFVNKDSYGSFSMFNLSSDTLTEYMLRIKNTDLINICGIFNLENKESLWRNHVFYIADPAYFFLCPFKEDYSKHVLEAIVFIELKRRDFQVSRAIIKNDEITFVHQNNDNYTYIQLEVSLQDKNIRKKVFTKLEKLTGTKYVISMDDENYSQKDVRHVNLIEFLKNENIITEGEYIGC